MKMLGNFKKADTYFGERRTQVIYQRVAEVEAEISVKALSNVLRVSASGHCAWKKRNPSLQCLKKKDTIENIKEIYEKEIYEENNQIYGPPKITVELHKRGMSISQRTVGLYMRESELRAWNQKPYTQTSVDSDFSSQLKNRRRRLVYRNR